MSDCTEEQEAVADAEAELEAAQESVSELQSIIDVSIATIDTATQQKEAAEAAMPAAVADVTEAAAVLLVKQQALEDCENQPEE